MSLSLVRGELQARLNTLATSLNIPVAWQGVEFKKTTSTYLEAFIIPIETRDSNVAVSRTTLKGSFQVNVWEPRGKGMKHAEEIAQSIVDAFPILPKTGSVVIEQTPSIDSPLYDAGWLIVPVTIRYRYDKLN